MKDRIRIYQDILDQIKSDNLFKEERTILTPQGVQITSKGQGEVLNFCANNYLGLANDKELINTAQNALATYGFGMASVRFICGTQDIHKELEQSISQFFQMDDTILYTSCFDANGGLFETLLNNKDAIISDELNHASIIDGVRLSKASRFRYKNSNMEDLENILKSHKIDVRTIGADYNDTDFTGKKICKDRGIKIHYNQRDHGYSTTELRQRIADGVSAFDLLTPA